MLRPTWMPLGLIVGTLSLSVVGGASAATVYLDLGAGALQDGPPPAGYESHVYSWNTVGPALNTTIADLVDSSGALTGIGLVVSDSFKFTNASGQPLPTGAAMEFWQGANDSLYLARDNAQPPDDTTAAITLSGLDPSSVYDFIFFGAHSNLSLSGSRSLVITATGAAVASTPEYVTSGHTGNVTSLLGVAPNASGEIVLDVAFGPNAVGSFAYLNAIKITEVVPEPASLGLLLMAAGGVLARRPR